MDGYQLDTFFERVQKVFEKWNLPKRHFNNPLQKGLFQLNDRGFIAECDTYTIVHRLLFDAHAATLEGVFTTTKY